MEGAIISLTEGAVRGLLCKLGGLLAQESWPVQRLHGEVQYIKDELESMNAFLRNLAIYSSEGHDDQVRVWMKQVREIAYDAEDCIDDFVRGREPLDGDGDGAVISSLCCHLRRLLTTLRSSGCGRHRRVLAQLQELKTRAKDAGERRSRYGVLPPETAPRTGNAINTTLDRLDPRLHALFTEEAQLVDIDGPRDQLVGWLMEEEARLRVLAIAGFGGLGKTTLARMVCGSPRVKGADFHCSPLLIVSQALNVRALFQYMLRELIHRPRLVASDDTMDDSLHGMESWETALLADKLRRHLQDKRYIVVLDDIWTSSAWENIRCVFPDNNKGSRIIITTRNQDVANTCCCRSQDRIYKMQRLSDKASRELFFKRIFGLDGTPNNELEEISNAILKKCGGLPLAIVSIGSLLASKPNITRQECQKVCDNLGSKLETNPTLEGTKHVLTLSYNDLPYHLKSCFLYLSIFPENYVIRRGTLVRMWIAEGFVTQRTGLSMEEVGERYFDEFVARSMVHPVKIDLNGKVRSCRVHDMMVEVIRSKSLEENFALFYSCENGTRGLVSHDKIRRLSIQSSNHSMNRTSTSVAHVRTFRMSPSIGETPFFFAHLRLLRVLDMQGSNCLSNKDLDSVCNFFQLKYLSIRNTSISKLPRLIGRLNHLETLDIRKTLIKKLPSSAKSLICLKHLLVGHKVHLTRTGNVKYFRDTSGLEMTPGVLRTMTSLQSVGHIEIKKDPSVFQEISLLHNLRKLIVLFSGVEANWKPFLELLSKLPGSVTSLSIHIFDGKKNCSSAEKLKSVDSPPLLVTSFSLTGKLEYLPSWVASLGNVSTFILRNNGLDANAIDILGELPNLTCLKLYHKSYADVSLVFPRDKFVKVKLLIIDNLENIDKVCFEEGSVPCLERLTLSFLKEPEYGILGLDNLLNLTEIEFFGNIISSVVTNVVYCVKAHANHPRVIGDKWNIVTKYA